MTARQAMKVVSIWWPRLAIERWAKASGGRQADRLALVVDLPHGQAVAALTDAAHAGGLRVGMRLTDARAIDPALAVVAADPAGDAALVARLARWASRWSPLVEIDGADGLRLDASGVAHLFGGEAGLLGDIEARFAGIGLTARAAIAPTAGAAWALARYAARPSPPCGEGRLGAAERGAPQKGERLVQDLAAMLAPLPVAALRFGAGVTRTLERLGLKTIGALAGVERRSLARRFREADNPLDALDRALGRRAEPLSAAPHEPVPRAQLRLAEPVADPAAAGQALTLMIPELVRQLEARRIGVRRLLLAGYRVDGEVEVAVAGCALASRETAHLRRLLAEPAGTLDPGFGFDGFVLEALWCEPLAAGQDGLIGDAPPELEVARLVDRLTVKLGAERVRRPEARASHWPERASGWVAAVEGGHSSRSQAGAARRPQRLFDRPEAIGVIYATPEGLPRRFIWRRGVHDVTKAEGPERIAPEWWRERGAARLRDYYRVEDRDGRRFWIFREGRHGDGRGGDPCWYLHGMFG